MIYDTEKVWRTVSPVWDADIHQVALRVDVMMNSEPVKTTENIVLLLIKYVKIITRLERITTSRLQSRLLLIEYLHRQIYCVVFLLL